MKTKELSSHPLYLNNGPLKKLKKLKICAYEKGTNRGR